MINHNVRIVGTFLNFIDAGVIAVVAYAGALVFPALTAGPQEIEVTQAWAFALIYGLLYLWIAVRLDAYHARRTDSLRRELIALAEIVLYSFALSVFLALMVLSFPTTFPFDLLFVATLVMLLGSRTLARILVRRYRSRGGDDRIWLLIGSNARSEEIIDSVNKHPHFGVKVLDVLDIEKEGVVHPQNGNHRKTPLLARVDDLRRVLAENVVDEVIVSLPLRTYYDEIQAIIDICHDAGISVKVPLDPFAKGDISSIVEDEGRVSLVTQYTGPGRDPQLVIKRFVDVAVSGLGLALLLPFFALIALAIRVDSRGPVFYRSTRVGLYGRLFTMIKFRTMCVDADKQQAALASLNETGGVAFKIKDDPRITRVGKILRQLHLDELPQLVNVFMGDMSLVGPRPLPITEASGAEWWHRRRLSMPPGLTCYWQVSGDHSIPFDDWAKLDLQYIDSWSLWVDLKLIFQTTFVIFRRQGW